jgi:RNA polymerase sigma-70 factor (ECF subfamily)
MLRIPGGDELADTVLLQRDPMRTQESDRGASAGEHPSADGPVDGAIAEGRDDRDDGLIDGLRRGDEAAFLALVKRYQRSLLRVVSAFVSRREVAEEVVQETWLAVLEGIGRFQGRSSLKTWITRIAINRAITRGKHEGRMVTFSTLARADLERDAVAVEPERFGGADGGEWAGYWVSYPRPWSEELVIRRETGAVLRRAIDALPPAQRAVITLRDVDGCTSAEVCNALGISETNQRVLLHRARSRVRRAVEAYVERGAV